jgi:microcystin-dependent protein
MGETGWQYPRGWAFCDGQLLPISENTALFSLVGTIYGGDGRTTFALPDLRGRVAVHAGSGPGLEKKRLGEKSGSSTVTLTQKRVAAAAEGLSSPKPVGAFQRAQPRASSLRATAADASMASPRAATWMESASPVHSSMKNFFTSMESTQTRSGKRL